MWNKRLVGFVWWRLGHVWWYTREKMYCDDNRPANTELEEMKAKLLEELEKLL